MNKEEEIRSETGEVYRPFDRVIIYRPDGTKTSGVIRRIALPRLRYFRNIQVHYLDKVYFAHPEQLTLISRKV